MKSIQQIVEGLNSKKLSVSEAANMILGEDITAGMTVAVVDDPIQGFSGAKGKVKGESSKGSGFVDVALENGTVMPMQSSLLVPVS